MVILAGFGIPALQLQGVTNDTFWLGLVALVLSYGAYVAEVFRAGIDSIHPSQVASADALGLSHGQAMRYVVLPQATRRVVPPLLNDFISLQKDTALLSSIFVFEALFAAQDYAAYNFNYTLDRRGRRAVRGADDPVGAVHRLDGSPDDAPGAGGCPMTPETLPVLRTENLRKAYGDKVVLRDIDLVVEPHDVVCLIGSSGSGKSTLLRCLDLLEDIDDGAIYFEGRDISDPRVDARAVRRRMGVVFQSYNLFPHLSVLDNLTLAPRKVHGVDRAAAEARAQELLASFGLAEKAHEHPDRLSGGQQQRVAMARAMATDPALLLLDEVTAALDPELTGEVLEIIRRLALDGTTMVLATHEMAFARDVATKVCFLHDGAILEQGPPAEIFENPREERTRQFLRRVLPS